MATEVITRVRKVDIFLRDMTPTGLSKLDRRVLSRLAKMATDISTMLRGLPAVEEATLFSDEDTPRIFFSPDNKPYIAMEVCLPGQYGFLDYTMNYLVAFEGEQINKERLMVLAFQDKNRTRRTVVLEATRKNLPDVLNELISF